MLHHINSLYFMKINMEFLVFNVQLTTSRELKIKIFCSSVVIFLRRIKCNIKQISNNEQGGALPCSNDRPTHRTIDIVKCIKLFSTDECLCIACCNLEIIYICGCSEITHPQIWAKSNLHFKQAHLLESQIMHSSHQSVTKQSSETDFVLRRDEKIVTITTRTVVILQNDCVGERFQFLLPVGYIQFSFLWLEKFLWKYLSMFEHNDTPTHSLENGSADNGLIVERIYHGAPSVENDMFTLRYT